MVSCGAFPYPYRTTLYNKLITSNVDNIGFVTMVTDLLIRRTDPIFESRILCNVNLSEKTDCEKHVTVHCAISIKFVV